MKKQELINICYKYLAGAFDRGLCCNPFDANNSECELPALHLKVAPNLVDEILLLHPLPEDNEVKSDLPVNFLKHSYKYSPNEKEELLKNFEEKISQQEDITPDWKDAINKVIDEMIDEMPKSNLP